MDKNSIFGILIISAIIIVFTLYTQPSQEELDAQRRNNERRRDSLEQVERERTERRLELEKHNKSNQPSISAVDSSLTDSAKTAQLKTHFGDFADAVIGEQKFITLENNKIKIKISSRGGRPYSVEIKDYVRYDSTPVVLFNGDDNNFGLKFFSKAKKIETNNLFFEPSTFENHINATEGNDAKVALKLKVTDQSYIEYIYELKPNAYMVDFDIKFTNMESYIATTGNYVDFQWQIGVPNQEKGIEWETDNTTIYYKHFEDEVDNLSERSDSKEEKIDTRLKWFAFKQHFFSSFLIADTYLENGVFKYEKNITTDSLIMDFDAAIGIPYAGKPNEEFGCQFYFGPNHHKTLRQYKSHMENIIPLGWAIFRWVNRFIVIPLFNWLGSFISSYGLIILIMTIIIKLGLFPLTYKSYLSSAKMRVLKPQVDEINKKFPKSEDAMKKQQAVMALYKRVGVNPMGGCLPMLLQFPILIAMFRFFPASIELRQQSFLWAQDLSTYDAIISWTTHIPLISDYYGNHVSLFCLLMAISMVVTTKTSSMQMDTGSNQMPGMKMMMYLMPVMMLFWFNNYSAGLSYYYLVSNIITFLQTMIIRRFVDDEAILKKLNANKKKPTKKSKFQLMLEQQQAKQKSLPQKGNQKRRR